MMTVVAVFLFVLFALGGVLAIMLALIWWAGCVERYSDRG